MKFLFVLFFLGILMSVENVQASGGPTTVSQCLEECRTFAVENAGKKFDRLDEDQLYFYEICQNPLILKQLDPADQQRILSLNQAAGAARIKLPAEQAAGLAQYIAFMLEALENESCDQQTAQQSDAEILQVWNAMWEELANGEIDQALNFFFQEHHEKYRRAFSKLDHNEAKKMTRATKSVAAREISGVTATYELMVVENGKMFSYELRMRRNSSCHWKILSF